MDTELTSTESSSATDRSASKKKQSTKTTTLNSNKAETPAEGRGDTKKPIVLELLRRKEGATIAEIAKATDWQNHSIRGFISGTVAKKMALAVESAKTEVSERNYRITS